jgi:hypothetical protein
MSRVTHIEGIDLEITEDRPPIASPLIDEPSPADILLEFGESSKNFMSLSTLESFAISTLPHEIVFEIISKGAKELNYNERYRVEAIGFFDTLKNILSDIKVERELGKKETLIPIAEMQKCIGQRFQDARLCSHKRFQIRMTFPLR